MSPQLRSGGFGGMHTVGLRSELPNGSGAKGSSGAVCGGGGGGVVEGRTVGGGAVVGGRVVGGIVVVAITIWTLDSSSGGADRIAGPSVSSSRQLSSISSSAPFSSAVTGSCQRSLVRIQSCAYWHHADSRGGFHSSGADIPFELLVAWEPRGAPLGSHRW